MFSFFQRELFATFWAIKDFPIRLRDVLKKIDIAWDSDIFWISSLMLQKKNCINNCFYQTRQRNSSLSTISFDQKRTLSASQTSHVKGKNSKSFFKPKQLKSQAQVIIDFDHFKKYIRNKEFVQSSFWRLILSRLFPLSSHFPPNLKSPFTSTTLFSLFTKPHFTLSPSFIP